MDAFDIARAVKRQWLLSAVLFVLGAVAIAAVAMTVPPQYQTSASLLVLREPGPASPNPYGLTDPAQIQTSTLLVDVLGSKAVVDGLAPPGVIDELTVTNESGPVQERTGFLSVDVRAATAEDTRSIAQRVVARAQDELDRRQDAAAVPTTERLRLDVVVAPDVIESSTGARWRAVGLLAALELVLIAVVVTVVDRRWNRERDRDSAPLPPLPSHLDSGAFVPRPASAPFGPGHPGSPNRSYVPTPSSPMVDSRES